MTFVMYELTSKTYLKVFLFLTVFLVTIRTEDCGQEELTQCAKPLQVLSATSELSFVTKKEELEKLCPDLHTGLRCIHSYTRRCMTAQQRTHFGRLYRGTENVIDDLCAEGEYQDEFLRHAPCMREVKSEYEICARRYENTMAEIAKPKNTTQAPHRHHHGQYQHQDQPLTEEELAEAEEKLKTVCCSFQEYMECSQHTVRRKCGSETSKFTKKFLDKMSSSLIQIHCTDYGQESGKCSDFISASWRPRIAWLSVLTGSFILQIIR